MGDIAILATSSRIQVETLRVDLELNLTSDLHRGLDLDPELVNFKTLGSDPQLINNKLWVWAQNVIS